MITGDDVIKQARKLIGYPYIYGGNSISMGGFDCSGLVQYSYKQAGITLPRTTYDQIDVGKKITNRADLKVGDLIFNFDSNGIAQHVFLYSGNGKVIEAQYEGTLINENSYWKWQGQAVRVLQDVIPTPVPIQPPVVKPVPPTPAVKPKAITYRVVAGSYADKTVAQKQQAVLKKSGFDSFLALYTDKGNYFRIVVGSYSDIQKASARKVELLRSGYSSFIVIYQI